MEGFFYDSVFALFYLHSPKHRYVNIELSLPFRLISLPSIRSCELYSDPMMNLEMR